MIDPLGADHHGYVPRIKAAIAALGPGGAFEAPITQLVNIVEGGQRAQMSKRKGEFADPRRAAGRHRRGRGALLPAAAQPRHRPRSRPRPRSQPVPGQPGLLRTVRASRGSPASCARPRPRAGWGPRARVISIVTQGFGSAPLAAACGPSERSARAEWCSSCRGGGGVWFLVGPSGWGGWFWITLAAEKRARTGAHRQRDGGRGGGGCGRLPRRYLPRLPGSRGRCRGRDRGSRGVRASGSAWPPSA